MLPKRDGNRPKSWTPFLIPAILVLLLLATATTWGGAGREPMGVTLKYGEFKRLLGLPGVSFRNLRVGKTDIRGEILTRDLVSGLEPVTKPVVDNGDPPGLPFRVARSGLELDSDLLKQIEKATGPNYQGDDSDATPSLASLAAQSLMLSAMLLMILLSVRWLMGAGSPLSFGRSRHKTYMQKDTTKVTFADVAGIDEAVAELREVVDFLKRPEKYQALGGRIPKGVLLVGPPGTGKTLLAKAVAGEAEVPFFSLSGSDFVEMFVGVGASRVRDLFKDAQSKAPCIVFIDELDALGKSRGGNPANPHEEREQTLNQLLVEMDGFAANKGVILMGATNRPETLDIALLRPGRFDRTVVVDRPDIDGREAILKVHARTIKMGDDVNLRRIASLTPGSVGADLANLVNEAALMAARAGKPAITMSEFDEAVERGAVGLERKSRIMKADEKRRVAYHEAGHALVACSLPNTDPVHKVSIIPRGVGALGYVLSRPDDDRYLMTRSGLESHIKVALGGTLAEELIFHEISNGATSDLNKATAVARSMVREYGMSRLGRISLRDSDGPGFLGPGFDGGRDYSEQTAREIDLEVRRLLDTATEEVRDLLARGRGALVAVAERLIEKEVMDAAELRELLAAHPLALHAEPAGPAVPGELNGQPHGDLAGTGME